MVEFTRKRRIIFAGFRKKNYICTVLLIITIMAEINQYKVVWEISELDARTPLHAAKIAQNWLEKDNWQFYVQDQRSQEIFSVDLQEEDEDAVLLVTGEYQPEIQARLNKKKTYYLFGNNACRIYEDDGFGALLTEIEDNGTDFGLFVFTEGETPSSELLYAAKGWNDYIIIIEEEYNSLVELQ